MMKRSYIEVANKCPPPLAVTEYDRYMRKVSKEAFLKDIRDGKFKQVERFTMTHFKDLDDETVIALAKGCPRLTYLELRFCGEIHPRDLAAALGENCPHLVVVNSQTKLLKSVARLRQEGRPARLGQEG